MWHRARGFWEKGGVSTELASVAATHSRQNGSFDAPGVDDIKHKSCITLRTLNYGNYGIILIMGNAGFISSTVALKQGGG